MSKDVKHSTHQKVFSKHVYSTKPKECPPNPISILKFFEKKNHLKKKKNNFEIIPQEDMLYDSKQLQFT